MATATRDPKTFVTPDAFSVDPSLLGTPLARPWRRGVALLIDIVLVALITALTSGLWFILGVVAAAFFFAGARRPGENARRSNAFRLFLGCMGVMVLSGTAAVFFGIRYLNELPEEFGPLFSIEEVEPGSPGAPSSDGAAADPVRTLLGGLQEGVQLRSVNDPDQAVALAVSVGRRLQALAPDENVEEMLRGIIPEEVGDVDGGEILARAMAQLSPTPQDVPEPPGVSLAEAIEVAGDTIGELEQDLAQANRDLEDTRAELDEAVLQGGLIRWFTSRIDSWGFGFGWWTLYFAILMPWMKGQTPGKRALGIRVVRLDGHPVTVWHAFERAGGYAAGLATGTLGFLQIYWDANRQGIHDKVAGTVVIQDGVPKVPGRWDQQVIAGPAQPSEPGPA